MRLVRAVYDASSRFPAFELYGLSSQMRRAAVSIPSNIAEGANRATTKEFIQFLNIAMGSAAELETQLLLSRDVGYMKEIAPTLDSLEEVRRMLSGLIRNLKNK